jgi:hypothetical protein
MLIAFTVKAAGMGVSVGGGCGVFVAGILVSVGIVSGLAIGCGNAVQATRKTPRNRTRALITRADLFFILLIIPTIRIWLFAKTAKGFGKPEKGGPDQTHDILPGETVKQARSWKLRIAMENLAQSYNLESFFWYPRIEREGKQR